MLFGRQDELRRLTGSLLDGRSTAVIGPAGIGKTALLRAAAQASGRSVSEGGGLASLSWRAYLPVARAVGDLDLRGEPAAVVDVVVAAVGEGILLIDDLHWADADTPALVPMLTGRVPVLAAIRRSDQGTADAVAAVQAGFDVVSIMPLSDSDATELVHAQRPDLVGGGVAEVVRRAGGNPLLLTELSAGGELPATLQLVLGARLRRCGPAAHRSMALLGLLARPAPPRLLGPGVTELSDASEGAGRTVTRWNGSDPVATQACGASPIRAT